MSSLTQMQYINFAGISGHSMLENSFLQFVSIIPLFSESTLAKILFKPNLALQWNGWA